MLELPHLRGIEDKRRAQGRRYDLEHVLLCCVLAVAAGADSYRAMARFIKTKLQWLCEHSALRWRRAPSHTGLRAVLLSVDQPAVEQALRSYAAGVLEAGREGAAGSCAIAIDGKTLRGSVDRFADVPALQWVSAFAAQQRLVVGQIALSGEDKGSEIAAARKLIEELGLSGGGAKRQRRAGSSQGQPTHAAAGHHGPGRSRASKPKLASRRNRQAQSHREPADAGVAHRRRPSGRRLATREQRHPSASSYRGLRHARRPGGPAARSPGTSAPAT